MTFKFIKPILKWSFRIISILILIVVVVLCYYSQQSIQRESQTAKDAAPETGRFVEADDVRIFYQEMGPSDGVPVILMHGTGSWSEIWRETMEALSENGIRVIAIDIPPFGFSSKPVGSAAYSTLKQGKRINALLDALQIDKAILVGHSVGSRPTMEALLQKPERIERLVLVDAALGFSTDSTKAQFLQNDPAFYTKFFFGFKMLRNGLTRSTGTNPTFTRNILESFVYNKQAITQTHLDLLREPLVVQNLSVAYGDWFEQLLVNAPHKGLSANFDNYRGVTIPVFLIWGVEDNITPLWQGKALEKLFPNSKLCVIENTGHIPYIESPQKFNAVLLDYLKDSLLMIDSNDQLLQH